MSHDLRKYTIHTHMCRKFFWKYFCINVLKSFAFLILLHISVKIFLLLICKPTFTCQCEALLIHVSNIRISTLIHYIKHTHIILNIMLTVWGCPAKKYKQKSNKFDKIMKQSRESLQIDLIAYLFIGNIIDIFP